MRWFRPPTGMRLLVRAAKALHQRHNADVRPCMTRSALVLDGSIDMRLVGMSRSLCTVVLSASLIACGHSDIGESTADVARETEAAENVFATAADSVVTIQTFLTYLDSKKLNAYFERELAETRTTETAGDSVDLMPKRYDTPVSVGSGVVVGRDEVVTNYHVLASGESSVVVTRNGRRLDVASTECDIVGDLCLLTVRDLELNPVETRRSDRLRVGEQVFAIGSPSGLSQSLSQGIVSGIREEGERRFIQTTAAISPGSSGGGLFDKKGALIGITTFGIPSGDQLGFALPADQLAHVRSIFAEVLRAEKLGAEKYAASCEKASTRRIFCGHSVFPPTECRKQYESKFGAVDPTAGRRWVQESALSPRAWHCAALLAEDLQDYEEASRAIEKVLELRPLPSSLTDAGRILRLRAHTLAKTDKQSADEASRKSLKYLIRATEVHPNGDDGWAELALTRISIGDIPGAQGAANKAIELNPTNSIAGAARRMIQLGMH